MKTVRVKDPKGVMWHMYVTHDGVLTATLDRAIERSRLTDAEKRKRRRYLGIPFFNGRLAGLFDGFQWRVGWGREHSFSWIVHAESKGAHHAWVSPALSRKDALRDLEELATQIRLGVEPDRQLHSP